MLKPTVCLGSSLFRIFFIVVDLLSYDINAPDACPLAPDAFISRSATLRSVLIYDLAKQHLVEELKYPPGLANMAYDKEFAIMVRKKQSSRWKSELAHGTGNMVFIKISVETLQYLRRKKLQRWEYGLKYARTRIFRSSGSDSVRAEASLINQRFQDHPSVELACFNICVNVRVWNRRSGLWAYTKIIEGSEMACGIVSAGFELLVLLLMFRSCIPIFPSYHCKTYCRSLR